MTTGPDFDMSVLIDAVERIHTDGVGSRSVGDVVEELGNYIGGLGDAPNAMRVLGAADSVRHELSCQEDQLQKITTLLGESVDDVLKARWVKVPDNVPNDIATRILAGVSDERRRK